MIFPGEQWVEASPASQSLDSTKLAAAIDYLRQNSGRDGVRELVIIRNGRMVWHGDDIDKVHGVWSCTKSFTSTALGLLIEDRKCTLDTLAQTHAPEMAASYPQVSLRHFTTMTSGYRAIGDEPHGSYVHGPSGTPFQPASQPLFTPPGSQYAYWDSAMNMFGLVLTRVAGEPLEQLFKRRIADPIGMHAQAWDWGDYATLDGVVVNGGSGNGGKHVTVSAREMARFGHLFLNRGRWNDQQLISPQWIEQATSVHVPGPTPWAQPESDIDGRGVYGFNWWTNGVQSNDKRLWPGAPAGTFAASGHNNNKLFVIPDWNMVIVRLGLDQSDGKISDSVWSAFLGKVGQSRLDARGGRTAPTPRSTVFPADSWRTQSPAELGLADDKLEAFAKSIGGDGVVIRNGYLVKSWGRPNRRGDWASSAKPVISTLLLFAVQEGKLQSVDDALRPWVQKHWPGKDLIDKDRTMTFRHLADMTSGYTRAEPPGSHWAYNDLAINLYRYLMVDVLGEPLNDAFLKRLHALQFQDGDFFGSRDGAGVNTSPRDFARLGWWWMHHGRWNDQQLLPREMFERFMRPDVADNLPRTQADGQDYLEIGSYGGGNDQNFPGQGVYGFNWWFNAPMAGGQERLLRHLPADAFCTIGHQGKEVMLIVPSWEIVVAARGDWGGIRLEKTQILAEAVMAGRD